jgi:hypothetical protein
MSDELVYFSATDLLGHYRAGSLSPVEGVKAPLDRTFRVAAHSKQHYSPVVGSTISRTGGLMPRFVSRPLEVQAEQYGGSIHHDRHRADHDEAERLRAALGIDRERLVAGSLPGWLEFFNPTPSEGGVLRPGMWLVLWPEGLLSGLEPAQFERLFVAGQGRQGHRIRVLKFGLIHFQPGDCTIRSRILNVSEAGAMLMPNDSFLCPNEFVLKPDIGEPHHCEVRWRKGTNMGVRFLNSQASIALLDPRMDGGRA